MHIAIPREIKPLEGRVGLVPEAAHELLKAGHQVSVESGAGLPSGYADQDYARYGIAVLPDAQAVYGAADMIVNGYAGRQLWRWMTLAGLEHIQVEPVAYTFTRYPEIRYILLMDRVEHIALESGAVSADELKNWHQMMHENNRYRGRTPANMRLKR